MTVKKNKMIQTYGKQNVFIRTYLEIKSAFHINPLTREALSRKGLEIYLPKLKRWRVFTGLFVFGILLITPFTPEFLIAPAIVGWMLK